MSSFDRIQTGRDRYPGRKESVYTSLAAHWNLSKSYQKYNILYRKRMLCKNDILFLYVNWKKITKNEKNLQKVQKM